MTLPTVRFPLNGAEVLSELEREYVLKTIRDVRALWASRESEFAAGFDLACEEIEVRLKSDWERIV